MDEGKLSLESKDIAAEKRQELLRLFPEAQTEGGKIDFDQLKRALGESVDAGRERYGMSWPGKADCFRLIQSPSTATLLPVRNDSVRFDETDNMIIEGDNLEVLKLLQKGYQNKVKLIYIDPPYNTGSDFIYPDDFSDNLKNYLQYTGQADAEGKKFSNNLRTDGRFHSKWLEMIYPRLYLARNLLTEDGVIFISIDDSEIVNLSRVCDEVFGENNRVGRIAVVNNPKGRSDDAYFPRSHEYLLVYSRVAFSLGGLEPGNHILDRYNKEEAGKKYREIDLRKTGDNDRRQDRPKLFYFFHYNPTTQELVPSREEISAGENIVIKPLRADGVDGNWRWELKTAESQISNLVAKLMPNRGVWSVFEKDWLDINETIKPTTTWADKDVNSERGTEQFLELGFAKEIFPRPKPLGLVKRVVNISITSPKDIVLDFFAGSGVTGQVIAEGMVGKFILVQVPEPTKTLGTDGLYIESEAAQAGYQTIAEITKERVRRVIARQDAEVDEGRSQAELALNSHSSPRRKGGFRVFKLAPSNFKVWDAHTDEGVHGVERQMELAVNHIMPDRSAEDLFYEILLKSEYPLTAKVENFDAAGTPAFSVENDSLIVCVERKVTAEAVSVIARRNPSKVIFLDEAFSGNDQLRANAKMNFESAGVKRFETV